MKKFYVFFSKRKKYILEKYIIRYYFKLIFYKFKLKIYPKNRMTI